MNGKRPKPVVPTRRQLLATLGTITAAGLAGCGGDGDDDSQDGEPTTDGGDPAGSNDGGEATPTGSQATPTDGQSEDIPWDSDDSSGGGGGCPSTPLSYTSRSWPDEDPYVSFEIPQEESVDAEVAVSGRLRILFGNNDTSITVRGRGEGGQGYFDQSVAERAENMNEEPTDAYDVASGVRVFTVPAGQTETPSRTEVLLPSGSGSVGVTVTIGVTAAEIVCQEAVVAAHRNLIETMSTV